MKFDDARALLTRRVPHEILFTNKFSEFLLHTPFFIMFLLHEPFRATRNVAVTFLNMVFGRAKSSVECVCAGSPLAYSPASGNLTDPIERLKR